MTTQSGTPEAENAPSAWTLEGFRQGALEILPLMPGLFAFGLAFGTVAARKGFSLADALAMSATVYAGVAQLVALETWPALCWSPRSFPAAFS
jgi:predicted branched-subunit amino acid permease